VSALDVMYAKLARFYGWPHHYIDRLSYNLFLTYYKAITPVQAEEYLMQTQVAAYPQMKPMDGKKFHAFLKRQASDTIERESKGLKSLDDVLGNLRQAVGRAKNGI